MVCGNLEFFIFCVRLKVNIKLKMKRVLVIEDEKMLAEMYKDKLDQEGFETLSAYDGEEGVEVALREEPDLILLDILLPKKEGTDVLKEVRESGEWGENVPIVMLTNLDSRDYIVEAINKYSPSYYFIKANVELNEMVEKIRELLNE